MDIPSFLSSKKPSSPADMESLQGQFLVAMPLMGDPRFFESVLYVVEHNSEGAMAIAIHDPLKDVTFGQVMADVARNFPADKTGHNIEVSPAMADKPVLRGGPVQKGRGFVLHASELKLDGLSFPINETTMLSADLEVLSAMARSPSGEKALFVLGYCGWSPGQLEGELAQNAWLTIPFNEELLFQTSFADRYDAALGLLGINRASLSAFGGRA